MLLEVGQRVRVKSYTHLSGHHHFTMQGSVDGIVVMGCVMSGLTLLGRFNRQVAFVALDSGEQVIVDVMVNARLTKNLFTDPYEVITREEGLVHWLAGIRKHALVDRLGEFITYGASPLEKIPYWREIEEEIRKL